MSDYKTQRNALDIINIVLSRLGVNEVTSLGETKLSSIATEMLNDVLDDLTNYSNWPQLYAETSVVTLASVAEYKINVNAQNIVEVFVSGQISPLRLVDMSEMRRLQRIGNYGIPRHFAIAKVSALAPYIRVHPIPRTPSSLDVAYYTKIQTIRASSGDNTYLVPFPSRTVVQGLYAAMLLEENGNQQTTEVVAANQLYERFKRENLASFVYDTGNETQFVPGGYGL